MRIRLCSPRHHARGFALALTLIFLAIALAAVTSLALWASNSATITERNNVYHRTVSAAEAATEVVIANVYRDFLRQTSTTNVNNYTTLNPDAFGSWSSDYEFSDGQGHVDCAHLARNGDWHWSTNVDAQYSGLYGSMNEFEVIADARQVTGPYPIAAGVRQTFQLAIIPLFQFAIFYNMDLEIQKAPGMVIDGRVHVNGNMYIAPSDTIEFKDAVSATGKIYNDSSPNADKPGGKIHTPVFDDGEYENVPSMVVPIGGDNSPTGLARIVDVPPIDEDPASQAGKERYYNKSDLIITTTYNRVTVQRYDHVGGIRTGLPVTVSTNIATGSGYSFIRTNVTFVDYREGSGKKGIYVLATEIDIQALKDWLATPAGAYANGLSADPIDIIYVDEQRSSDFNVVRVANGRNLPDGGLTVATARPLYVLGDYNAPTLGSTNTADTKPASLIGDAVTVLSSGWSDTYGLSPVSANARPAANTTVNAAIIAGITASTKVNGKGNYSGGVENLMRFSEDWGDKTLTYNGSLCVLFPSRYATGYWKSGAYFNDPNRNWSFDNNFADPAKLPPGTPQLRKLQRSQWAVVAATSE